MNQYFILLLVYELLISGPCLCRQSVFESFFDNYNTAISNSPIRDTKKFLPEYDFIIVGAGSGGSVIANRLTEERDWTVLLLESGKEESVITDVPISSAVTGITGMNISDFVVIKIGIQHFYIFGRLQLGISFRTSSEFMSPFRIWRMQLAERSRVRRFKCHKLFNLHSW